MFSSLTLNEIRQVYTTLEKRMKVHLDWLSDSTMGVDLSERPGVHMSKYYIHETDMVRHCIGASSAI
jgi:hypothetical protein